MSAGPAVPVPAPEIVTPAILLGYSAAPELNYHTEEVTSRSRLRKL
jgi:hypothetical protein